MPAKILLVDDDPDVMLFNKTVAEENGFQTVTAANGEEGLALLEKEHPDLVVLDVLMPRQSGVKMYRTIKTEEKWRDIPVIILSGISRRSFLKSQEALTEFGEENVPQPEAYLEKPVEAGDLARTIQNNLKKAEN